MIKLFLRHTIGTKAFLYTGVSVVLVVWFIYFHIFNFQFWMNSDMHVLISVICLLVSEGIIIYVHEFFRDKRIPVGMEKAITERPTYEDFEEEDKQKNSRDHIRDWTEVAKKNAELEYFEKLEKKHEK